MEKICVKALGTVSPHCSSEGNCPGYLISTGENKILLDAGNGITRLMNLKEDLKNLKVILTHDHWDHIGDIFNLGYDSYLYNETIDIYVPHSASKLIDALEGHSPTKWNIHDYNGTTDMKFSNYRIECLKTKHSDTSYAIKISDNKYINNKIVYTSDIGINDIESIIDFAKGSDLLICESSLNSTHHVYNPNHLHAYESGMIADCAKVKKLVLTHFWPEGDRNQYVKEAKINFSNTVAAKDGDTYFI